MKTKFRKLNRGLIVAILIGALIVPGFLIFNHQSAEAGNFDTGWISINDSRISGGAPSNTCNKSALIIGKNIGHLLANLNLAKGNYVVDIEASYGQYRGDPVGLQNNETLALYTGQNVSSNPPASYENKRNVPDLNNSESSWYDKDSCSSFYSTIKVYKNIAGTLSVSNSTDIKFFATGSSIHIYKLRVRGNIAEDPQPPPPLPPPPQPPPPLPPPPQPPPPLPPPPQPPPPPDPVEEANLSITKEVRNITQNTNWLKSVTAEVDDQLAFSIEINSLGNETAKNVWVDDLLPSYYLEYIPGTTRVDNISAPDGITQSGIPLGNLEKGEKRTIIFEGRVIRGPFSLSSLVLENRAVFKADNAQSFWDKAEIIVEREVIFPQNTHFSLTKKVRNISRGGGSFSTQTSGYVGDELEFYIHFENDGQYSAKNVVLRDELPLGVKYISGTCRLNGNYVSGGGNLFENGLVFNSISSGESNVIRFSARIKNYPLSWGSYFRVANRASLGGDNISSQYSQAEIIIYSQNNYQSPFLSLIKKVRNNSRDEVGFLDQTTAFPGEELEFYIKLKNLGEEKARNVRVFDSLPHDLEFISNSLYLDGSRISQDIINHGVFVGDISQNDYHIIRFRAKVKPSSFFYSFPKELTNNAWASSDNDITRRDEAYILIEEEEEPPISPPPVSPPPSEEPKGIVAGAATVATGPVDAFIVSLLMTLILTIFAYIWIRAGNHNLVKETISRAKFSLVCKKERLKDGF